MRHHSRSTAFAMLLLMVALIASGCILLDSKRLNNFTGPSWDVPITLPISSKTEYRFWDALDTTQNDEGVLGFSIAIAEFEAFVAPVSGDSDFTPDEPIIDESVVGLVDVSGIPEFDFALADLIVTIVNEPGLKGKIDLEFTGLDEQGNAVCAPISHTFSLDAEEDALDIAPILNAKPQSLRVKRVVTFDEQRVTLQEGQTLAIQSKLWIPLTLEIPAAGASFDIGAAALLNVDEGMRQTLETTPISEVQFVLDLESRIPFGFDLVFAFANNADPALDPDSIEMHLEVPAAPLNENGTVAGSESTVLRLTLDEKLRGKLINESVYVSPKAIVNNEIGTPQLIRLSHDDSLSFKAYVIVTVGINKNDRT